MKSSINLLLREAETAARAGQTGLARRRLHAVVQLDPHNVAALLWLTWLDEDPRARQAYARRALACDPHNASALAAADWARNTVAPSRVRGPSPKETIRAARRRWWSRVAAALATCLLVATAAGASAPILRHALPALAAPIPSAAPMTATTAEPSPTAASTRMPIPTWTPTPTALPTGTPTPAPPPTAISRPATPTEQPAPQPSGLPPSAFHRDVRWIDVDLTQQRLVAYEGQEPVREMLVSTGTADTPTPTGLYRIRIKMRYDDMDGPDYHLPRVPYVLYFHRGYSLHGTYWHSNFGHPMSHGCVNLPTVHAKWLYDWADLGTLVNIHH